MSTVNTVQYDNVTTYVVKWRHLLVRSRSHPGVHGGDCAVVLVQEAWKPLHGMFNDNDDDAVVFTVGLIVSVWHAHSE